MRVTEATDKTQAGAPADPAATALDSAAAWRLLAPAIAGRPRVRVSRDGGRTYPRGCEQDLTDAPPNRPAAVMLFDHDAAARCLVADFDSSRSGQAQVDADAAAFAALIEACGGRSFADVSPNGGRHVYVLWSRPRPITDLRPLLRALSALYPSLDVAPMSNPAAGCIRPPGARHRSGGHQQLTTPLPEALAVVQEPCGPEVWGALLDRVAPEIDEPEAEYGGHGGPVTPAAGSGARLPDRLERIARTGTWEPDRYASASEARQAVLTAAAAAGWALPDVALRVETGLWPGLAGLYARYSSRNRRVAMGRDWRKAHAFLSREETPRNSPTRGSTHSGGIPTARSSRSTIDPGSLTEYRWIRAWWNAALATERIRWTDRAGLSKRLVIRALGAMAQRRGTRIVDVGRRSLALACGLDDSTVGAVLRVLRDEPDPVIELLEKGAADRPDRYSLRIPDAGLHAAAWRRWKAGPIAAIRPVFRELGPTAALVHEQLGPEPLSRRQVRHDAALPPSTVDEALHVLAEHGLAERVPGNGWRLGPTDPDRVARSLEVDLIVAGLVERYRAERAAWRAFLDTIGRRSLIPVRRTRAPDPITWPAVLSAPPPTDRPELAYDRALADSRPLEEFDSVVELLHRDLGATVLSAPHRSLTRLWDR